MKLYDSAVPALKSGKTYTIKASQTYALSTEHISKELSATRSFSLEGPTYPLDPTLVANVYPPAGSDSNFEFCLPHIAFRRASLPWEFEVKSVPGMNMNGIPWMMLACLQEGEYEVSDGALTFHENIPTELLPAPQVLKLLTHVREEDIAVSAVCANRSPRKGKNTAFLLSIAESTALLASSKTSGIGAARFPILYSWSFTHDPSHGTLLQFAERLNTEVIYGNNVDADKVSLANAADKNDHAWYHGPLRPVSASVRLTTDVSPSKKGPEYVRPFHYGMKDDLSYSMAFTLGRLMAIQSPSILAKLREWGDSAFQLIRTFVCFGHETNTLDPVIEHDYFPHLHGGLDVIEILTKATHIYDSILSPMELGSSTLLHKSEKELPGLSSIPSGGRRPLKNPRSIATSRPAFADLLHSFDSDLSDFRNAEKKQKYQIPAIFGKIGGLTSSEGKTTLSLPESVRDFLVGLRLLEGVPLDYLVPNQGQVLKDDTVYFFFIDRAWTDALVEGALSAGATTGLEDLQLQDAYQRIRSQLDKDEHGRAYASVGLCGFIVCSTVFASIQDLKITASGFREVLKKDGSRDSLVAVEKPEPALFSGTIASDLTIAIFDLIPTKIEISEPSHALHMDTKSAKLQIVEPSGVIEYSSMLTKYMTSSALAVEGLKTQTAIVMQTETI